MTDALILSNALDTNGQNARYVKASEDLGDAPEVITALAIGKYDPAGVVGRYQLASEKRPEVGLRIRSAHRQKYATYDFPGDLEWTNKTRNLIYNLAQAADVIHLNNSDVAARHFRVLQKPILLHHHGSMFRNNPDRMLQIARSRKMVQGVSTIDLIRPAPDVLHWLPTAYDVAELNALGRKYGRKPDGRIRIVHAPTGSTTGTDKFKHTELFTQMVHELIKEGLPIDLVILRDVSQMDVLRAKAKADIVYDQLTFGYGCNSVEAWSMGKPVISGADDWTTRKMVELWGKLPYEKATVNTLKSVIKRMVIDKDRRLEAAHRGMAHVLKYHDELPALTRLAELYHDAIHVRTVPRIQGKGITFRSVRNRRMHVDGVEVNFRGGVATVTDELAVARLRETARTRPGFGISEDEGVA